MKAVNAYYRKHKALDGCPDISPEQGKKLTAGMASYDRVPYPAWALSNNNAEIRRVKDRIQSLSRQKEIGYVGWEFDGGKVEANTEANRLQVFFEEKPDDAARAELKSNGFRWSPKEGAWQRQLTDNAYFAANYIKSIAPLTGEKPTDLQRAHIREQKAAAQQAAAPEPIYKVHTNPRSDSRDNLYLLQAYIPQEDGKSKIGDVLYIGTPEKCRELMAQLTAGELTQAQVKELYAQAQEAAQTTLPDKDTFSIYQLKRGDETRNLRFEPYDRLQAAGKVVDKANYELVYSAELTPGTSLEDIYTRFNTDHPKDFKGHSLSVSDVVVLHQNGQDAAHYVDSFGYKDVLEFLQPTQTIPQTPKAELKFLLENEIPILYDALYCMKIEDIRLSYSQSGILTARDDDNVWKGKEFYDFLLNEAVVCEPDGSSTVIPDTTLQQMRTLGKHYDVAFPFMEQADNPLVTAEKSTEQNENMIDGIINNEPPSPTVEELEAKLKAGETISLVDLANAVKADNEKGKAAKPEKKPSIRAQLRADKEQAKKKPSKEKSRDLERS